MRDPEAEVYVVCTERNTPEAFRHFFDRAFSRFEDPLARSWRQRLARRFSLLYRTTRSDRAAPDSAP